MRPSDFRRYHHSHGERFQVREMCGQWEVYGTLGSVCMCLTAEAADMVADALEAAAERHEAFPVSANCDSRAVRCCGTCRYFTRPTNSTDGGECVIYINNHIQVGAGWGTQCDLYQQENRG